MPAHLENSAVVTGWKRSVFITIPKKSNTKECSNYCTITLNSHSGTRLSDFTFTEYWRLISFKTDTFDLLAVQGTLKSLLHHHSSKASDNIQPWHTPFPIWNQSVVPCPVLTVASWPAYRFVRSQVRDLKFPSLGKFSSLLWSTHSKALE